MSHVNVLFFAADNVDQYNLEASNAKCNQIQLPMTVANMDGYKLYNFSVSLFLNFFFMIVLSFQTVILWALENCRSCKIEYF